MPVRGIQRVKRNYKMAIDRIANQTTDRTVYEILSQGGAMAATMTPIDTSALINSHFAEIKVGKNKVVGVTGYTAKYAAAVHDASGVLKGRPRDPNKPGRGDFWDPNAEPGFLVKGFDEIKPSIPAILKRNYKK